MSLGARRTKMTFYRPRSRFSKPYRGVDLPTWCGVPSVQNPVGYYKFEDPTTTCKDSSGFSNDLTHDAQVLRNRQMVGLWNGRNFNGFRGCEYTNYSYKTAAPNNTLYNFASVNFGGMAIFRSSNYLGASSGLLGKLPGATLTGWAIFSHSSARGDIQFYLRDGTNNPTCTANANHHDGAWHYMVWWVNRSTKKLRIFTDLHKPTEVSYATLNSISNTLPFNFGQGYDGFNCSPFQIAMCAIWDDITGLDNPTAWDALWARLTTRSLSGLTSSLATKPQGAVVANDSAGEMLTTWAPGEIRYGYNSLLATSPTNLGIQQIPGYAVNLLTESDVALSPWATSGTATVTTYVNNSTIYNDANFDGPSRIRNAVQITKTAANANRRHTVGLTNGTKYVFSVWLKVHNASFVPVIRIRDNGDTTTKASTTCSGMVADKWQRFDVVWTADATANFIFEIHPDAPANTSGTVYAQNAQVDAGFSHMQPFFPSLGAQASSPNWRLVTKAVLINNDEGKISADYVPFADSAGADVVFHAGTFGGANGRSMYIQGYGSSANTMTFFLLDGSAGTIFVTTVSFTPLTELNTYMKWIAVGSGGNDAEIGIEASVGQDAGTFTANAGRNTMNIGEIPSVLFALGMILSQIDIREKYV